MNKPGILLNALFGLAALALIAALAFLYDKTQAVDLREQNEIAGWLRDLKEIDGRWDVDVLRARTEFGNAQMPVIDRAAAASKALQYLQVAVEHTQSAALRTALPEINKAIRQKAELIEKFNAASAGASAGLDGVLRNGAELAGQVAEMKVRAPALDAALSRLAHAAPLYYWLGQDEQQKNIEAALNDLQNTAATLPEAQRIKAEQARNAGLNLLKHKPVERELAAKLAFLTSGPRLDTLSFSFNRELEATLQEKERYRVYLIYYAGALLILLAYLGFRLKAANVGLEHRVAERTRELSAALLHLKESEAQLIQSEKMSSLGQMVAGVAHEINTPLAYVKNSLGAVADKLPHLAATIAHCEKLLGLLQTGNHADAAELNRQFALAAAQIAQLRQQRVLEDLGGLVKDGLYGTGQMADIVGNLKDFSRLDRSKVTSHNLNDSLTSTLSLAKHLLKTVTVNKQFGEIPAIICSPSQINQVFLNLVTNAVQAMEGGRGTVTLTTRSEAGGVTVEIADNGKGIAPEVLPKIFDPFFTTKEAGKGTGLGLSVSYKIVQQHGGRIDVKSQMGAGTQFTVWLPLKPPAEAQLPA